MRRCSPRRIPADSRLARAFDEPSSFPAGLVADRLEKIKDCFAAFRRNTDNLPNRRAWLSMDCFFHRKNEDLLIPWIFLGGFLTGDVFMLQFLDASPSCTASGRLGVSSTRCLKRGWTTKRAVTTWDFRLLNHTWLFGQHPEANSHRLFAPVSMPMVPESSGPKHRKISVFLGSVQFHLAQPALHKRVDVGA